MKVSVILSIFLLVISAVAIVYTINEHTAVETVSCLGLMITASLALHSELKHKTTEDNGNG